MQVIAVRNLARLETSNALLSAFSRIVDTLRHKLRSNTISGSRKNIHAHYDLGTQVWCRSLPKRG